MFSDGELDHLVALDASTCEEIWRYRIAATFSFSRAASGCHPAAWAAS
jgi:hypothetical protein